MSRRALALTAAAALAGCSLIVPLDYTGGTPPSHEHGGQSGTAPFETGGSAGDGLGGTLGDAGMSEGGQGATAEGGADEGGASGGTEPSTGGDTSAGKGGTTGGTGAMGVSAGAGGSGGAGDGGTGGGDASGGMNTGGLGGTATVGGMSGQGGTPTGGLGGMGGMSGTSTAGNANCPDADLSSDPANCGSCGHACDAGVVCEKGLCVTSPCVGLTCAHAPMPMPFMQSDGYRMNSVGTADICYEVLGYAEAVVPKKPSIISWNLNGRTLEVNGIAVPQTNDPGYFMSMPERGGGYCIHMTAGDPDFAGMRLPLPGEL